MGWKDCNEQPNQASIGVRAPAAVGMLGVSAGAVAGSLAPALPLCVSLKEASRPCKPLDFRIPGGRETLQFSAPPDRFHLVNTSGSQKVTASV